MNATNVITNYFAEEIREMYAILINGKQIKRIRNLKLIVKKITEFTEINIE